VKGKKESSRGGLSENLNWLSVTGCFPSIGALELTK